MAFSIEASELWVVGDESERLPLRGLGLGEHLSLHGRLEIRFGGKLVPRLGFFGPDDVCLGNWVKNFTAALALAPGPSAFSYDEGEQGQPQFVFERTEDDRLVFSITASDIGGGDGEPSFGEPSVPWAEFDQVTRRFLEKLKSNVQASAPEVGEAWWRHWTEG